MEDFIKFKNSIIDSEYIKSREILRDNYTAIEKYCKANKINKNHLEWISGQIDLLDNEESKKNIIELIKLDYVRGNDFFFKVKPEVVRASDFLRSALLNVENENQHKIKYNQTRAVLYIIEQVRHNLTHDGKFETDDNQLERNTKLVKYCALILDDIVNRFSQD